jgi:hypothetical protein
LVVLFCPNAETNRKTEQINVNTLLFEFIYQFVFIVLLSWFLKKISHPIKKYVFYALSTPPFGSTIAIGRGAELLSNLTD